MFFYFNIIKFKFIFFIILGILSAQTHISADPSELILNEKYQFENKLPIKSNVFRPIFFNTDSISFSLMIRNESYYNDNLPNQENMDVRYFSKGIGNFNSFQLSFNSPYLLLMVEPFILNNINFPVKKINRTRNFSVLNDVPLSDIGNPSSSGFRNLLLFFHYKGFGFGYHKGNRWWGPGIHTSFQMTNNTQPIPALIIGTMQELRIGSFGFYGLYSFTNLNNKRSMQAKYFTSLNGQISWYGPAIVSLGFSRNYLSGGELTPSGYIWTKEDAQKIVFEGFLTSDLIGTEHTVGGHDSWDQTLSIYSSVILPDRGIKLYAEIGVNDNRMYFADLLSQPDHSVATIFGVRDYSVGKNKNIIWGFEWTNLMITYTSRHRPGGEGIWYNKEFYDYSTYKGRRWGAHSGTDSDDWYLYAGYLSDKLIIIPGLNYERHGIVTHRPAEVKIEYRLDTRYKFKNIWFGIYLEKQFEAFLGFPDYFYTDNLGNPIDASSGKLANSQYTNTLIFSISNYINF